MGKLLYMRPRIGSDGFQNGLSTKHEGGSNKNILLSKDQKMSTTGPLPKKHTKNITDNELVVDCQIMY